jgi:hypothetical protein
VRFVDTPHSNRRAAGPSPLRLAWVNPSAGAEGAVARAELRLVPHAAIPPRAVKLDLAIERHLTGADGLTRDEFLLAFAGRGAGSR